LPTGQIVDGVEGLEVTLIDNGMPVVVAAQALGVSGYESEQIVMDDESLAGSWFTVTDKSYDLVWTNDWTRSRGRLHHVAFVYVWGLLPAAQDPGHPPPGPPRRRGGHHRRRQLRRAPGARTGGRQHRRQGVPGQPAGRPRTGRHPGGAVLGAARAVAVELALAGARQITIASRRPGPAADLARLVPDPVSAEILGWQGAVRLPPDTDVLINATPVGLYPTSTPCPRSTRRWTNGP
jgi:PrpF protein